jgi:hypothetical protein
MISSFRHIALGGDTRKLNGWQRVAAHLARIGSLLTVLIFFADTINADILYAAIIGDIQFQDNPLILDSATDSTSVVPDIHSPHINYFELAKYDGGATQISRHIIPKFFGTTIIEDEDSPTVLDGATTSSLTYVFHNQFARLQIDEESAVTTLDRTITYSRLMI